MYSRFRRWQRAGVWDRVLAALQADADGWGELDWSLHFLDGTTIRAHPHPVGAKRGGGDQALGRSRGGFSAKLHLRTERGGKPVTCVLTAGQRHEASQIVALLEGVPSSVLGAGDKGY